MLTYGGGHGMNSNSNWESLRRIYKNVEITLWAVLSAFVIYFAVFVGRSLPAQWAQAEKIRVQEIGAENSHYCEMMGSKAGTQKHEQCALYLREFRLKVEKRIADESDF